MNSQLFQHSLYICLLRYIGYCDGIEITVRALFYAERDMDIYTKCFSGVYFFVYSHSLLNISHGEIMPRSLSCLSSTSIHSMGFSVLTNNVATSITDTSGPIFTNSLSMTSHTSLCARSVLF